VFGNCTVGWVTDGDPDAFPVPLQPPPGDPFSGAKSLYYETGATLFHFVDAR